MFRYALPITAGDGSALQVSLNGNGSFPAEISITIKIVTGFTLRQFVPQPAFTLTLCIYGGRAAPQACTCGASPCRIMSFKGWLPVRFAAVGSPGTDSRASINCCMMDKMIGDKQINPFAGGVIHNSPFIRLALSSTVGLTNTAIQSKALNMSNVTACSVERRFPGIAIFLFIQVINFLKIFSAKLLVDNHSTMVNFTIKYGRFYHNYYKPKMSISFSNGVH